MASIVDIENEDGVSSSSRMIVLFLMMMGKMMMMMIERHDYNYIG
jgi:hypothetical protein